MKSRFHSKLSENDIELIKQARKNNITLTCIAKQYKVSVSIISRIVNDKDYNYSDNTRIRCTPHEKKLLKIISDRKGVPLSKLIREFLKDGILKYKHYCP